MRSRTSYRGQVEGAQPQGDGLGDFEHCRGQGIATGPRSALSREIYAPEGPLLAPKFWANSGLALGKRAQVNNQYFSRRMINSFNSDASLGFTR